MLGEHSREVLAKDLGLAVGEVDALLEAGTITGPRLLTQREPRSGGLASRHSHISRIEGVSTHTSGPRILIFGGHLCVLQLD